MSQGYGIAAISIVVALTAIIGAFGLRISRTTSDFYVASRTVSPLWNASAIGGEYLSAASFLGVAGLILAYGADLLWLPVGFTGGYLIMLVLVAAPLRRSGAYTLPDFTELRLNSTRLRALASVLVVGICWLYLMPQFQGAGLTLRTVTGAPLWAGELIVAIVVVTTVAAGGMRSITFVQAFQYWLKVTAILLPAAFLFLSWHADDSPSLTRDSLPRFAVATTVTAPEDLQIRVTQPVVPRVTGVVDGLRYVGGVAPLAPGPHTVAEGTRLDFPAGAPVPVEENLPAATDEAWAQPLSGGREHSLYTTYSLIIATMLGTMGLPHILVRFYTNPDGGAARRTTLAVLALLGVFYLGPTLFGALGRIYAPDLLLTGRVDSVVLELPSRMVGGTGGDLLSALVTAGAFAAFLSTAAGLTMSAAAVLSQDVFRSRDVRTFQLAAVPATLIPFLFALIAGGIAVGDAVSLAFAVAASTFCPLLVLGVWWRRLSTVGAAAGMVVGGASAGAAVLATIIGGPYQGWTGALLAQPAAITVPAAFLVMIGVSLLTPRHVPSNIHRIMVRLHVPEGLGQEAGDFSR
ncbi:cation acetate symporter [Sporichthya sp.]|uniref:sodium/solute symporter n=1 Tax=Sporichthya sp. TaxID=65475 RepID=UPI00184128D8|nr:cation acetate symporter [Sporichthya sp.]MBA3744038.1 cation acetate symporter [Sporichthya sp.]